MHLNLAENCSSTHLRCQTGNGGIYDVLGAVYTGVLSENQDVVRPLDLHNGF